MSRWTCGSGYDRCGTFLDCGGPDACGAGYACNGGNTCDCVPQDQCSYGLCGTYTDHCGVGWDCYTDCYSYCGGYPWDGYCNGSPGYCECYYVGF